jgi:hypothetical protein
MSYTGWFQPTGPTVAVNNSPSYPKAVVLPVVESGGMLRLANRTGFAVFFRFGDSSVTAGGDDIAVENGAVLFVKPTDGATHVGLNGQGTSKFLMTPVLAGF